MIKRIIFDVDYTLLKPNYDQEVTFLKKYVPEDNEYFLYHMHDILTQYELKFKRYEKSELLNHINQFSKTNLDEKFLEQWFQFSSNIHEQDVSDSIEILGSTNLVENGLSNVLNDLMHDLCPVTQPYLDGYDVVTKGRIWSDTTGLTGDLILNIPTDLVGQDVITGGLAWEDIMDRIGVIPVDTVGDVVIPWDDTLDVPETIPDAIDRVNDTTIDKPGTEDKDDEKTDEDEDLDIKIPSAVGDLKKQFPFCIPFDLIDCVKMFSADAKAPKWEFDIYIKPIKYHWILTIDMSDYETLVKLFKTGQVILFIVGLAILTPTVTKWNGGGE